MSEQQAAWSLFLACIPAYLAVGYCFGKYRAYIFWDNFQHTVLVGTARRSFSFCPAGTPHRTWGTKERIIGFLLFPMTSGEALRRLTALDAPWRIQSVVTARCPWTIFLVNTWESSWFRTWSNSGRWYYVLVITLFWPVTLVWSALCIPIALLFHGVPLLRN